MISQIPQLPDVFSPFPV